jgi:Ala-tRNA(Pro) deacylase
MLTSEYVARFCSCGKLPLWPPSCSRMIESEVFMTTLQRCLEFLDHNQIRYAHTGHRVAYTALEVAAAEHLPAAKLAKTVVFFDDRLGYGMAVLAADRMVDLDELRGVTGSHNIRLATETEIGRLFRDSELGAMPPIGNLFDLPVYVDQGLAHNAAMAFSAGTHRDVIHMTFADFRRAVQPKIVTFARKASGVN